jgi:hypothetical protein
MALVYEYRAPGRSGLNIGSILVVLGAELMLWQGGVAVWTLCAATAALLAHQVLAYPCAGCRIAGDHLTTFIDRRRRVIALKKVRKALLFQTRSGRWACRVQLQDRSFVTLPAACLPPPATLARALRRRGIRVEIDRRPGLRRL